MQDPAPAPVSKSPTAIEVSAGDASRAVDASAEGASDVKSATGGLPENKEMSLGEFAAASWKFLRSLGPTAILGGLALSLPPLGSIVLFMYMNTIGSWFRGHEGPGVALYIAGFAVCAGFALLPTYASAILGGWAFGFAIGLPAALAGFLGASIIGYAVAMRAAGDRVDRVIGSNERWLAVRDALVRSSWGKAFLIVWLVRIPPNSPFALTNLVLASVRVPISAYALGTVLGMAPRTAFMVFLATKVQDQLAVDAARSVGKTPWWLIVVGLALTLGVLWIISTMAQAALARLTGDTRSAKSSIGG